ncbi:uncharacterized protein JCM6883_005441 [Sporobolomyces salmoneus]|uniref:uncharacterized protein n=1 Tax=Sporobolomyces salmoneus TaxID=183962 RepID=UPI003180AF4A
MSDESFAAIDAMLNQEVHLVSTLTEENARLRALIEQRDPIPTATPPAPSLDSLDAAALLAELRATKLRQDEMAREMEELRQSQTVVATAAKEDQSSEVALLRASLADLAEQLGIEKQRVSEIEAKRKEEEDKVAILRSKVEDSRKALMRLQGESTKRASMDASNSGFSFPTRRSSLLDGSSTRRRSSLGLASISGSPSLEEPSVVGLGLGVESPASSSSSLLGPKPSSSSSATPFARFAHRRGSASISHMPEEEDRTARLRDLRLGAVSTKISSRRNSSISGVPDFLAPDEFSLGGSNRRMSNTSKRNRNSICEEEEEDREDVESGPPSAGLRLRGRRESAAVFEQFSRRSSSSETALQGSTDSNVAYTSSTVEDLKLQLEGLRIQLAESEEGRRASELCLQALKEFISKSDSTAAPENVSLPPLPSDPTMDAPDHSVGTSRSSALPRWSIPRLSIGSRRESSQSSGSPPGQRRTSASSTLSTSTLAQHDRATPSMPSFGGFSFSALVSRSTSTPVSGDTSPTAPSASFFPSSPQETFPVEPSPLLPSDPEHDDAMSTAPSLVSDLSSGASVSPSSSRASSPSPRTSDVGLPIAEMSEDELVTRAAQLEIDIEKPAPHLIVEASNLPQAL